MTQHEAFKTWRVYRNVVEIFLHVAEELDICRKIAAYPFHQGMWKCSAIIHWNYRMEMLQIQSHLQKVLDMFCIPLFTSNFRESWTITIFKVCKVTEVFFLSVPGCFLIFIFLCGCVASCPLWFHAKLSYCWSNEFILFSTH